MICLFVRLGEKKKSQFSGKVLKNVRPSETGGRGGEVRGRVSVWAAARRAEGRGQACHAIPFHSIPFLPWLGRSIPRVWCTAVDVGFL